MLHLETLPARPTSGRGSLALSPFFLIRVAGESIDLLRSTETGETAALVTSLHEQSHALLGAKDTAIAVLEGAINGCTDSVRRKLLLNLKRDAFNLRKARAADLEALGEALPAAQGAIVRDLFELIASLRANEMSLQATYDAEIAYGRSSLAKLVAQRNLRGGIQASSVQLYRKIGEELVRPTPFDGNKDARSLADTMMHYAKRTTQKTSPFASFTPLAIGKWDAQSAVGLEIELPAMGLRTSTVLKPAFVHHILEPWLRNASMIGEAFDLALNPTLRIDGDAASWLRLNASDYPHPRISGHNAPVVKTGLNGGLRNIIALFERRAGIAARPSVLKSELRESLPDAAHAAIDPLFATLVDMGLLLACHDRFEQEDVLVWAEHVLERIGAAADEARSLVVSLRCDAQTYVGATLDERASVSERLHSTARALAKITGADLPDQVYKPILYEDCFVAGERVRMHPAAVAPVLEDLRKLIQLAPVFDFYSTVQAVVAARFVKEFGEDGVCLEPAAYLRDLDDDINGNGGTFFDAARYQVVHEELIATEVGAQLDRLRRRFVDRLLGDVASNPDEIILDREFVEELIRDLPPQVRNRRSSLCFAGQFETNGAGRFAINQIFPGKSNLMSRFYSDLSESELALVREHLREAAGDRVPAELCGVFGFAANLHPRLTDSELRFPGYSGGRKDGASIALQDTELAYDRKTDRVYLRDTRGVAIDAMYLGFLAPFYLPSPLRLLTMLGNHGLVSFVAGQIDRKLAYPTDAAFVMPRVCFGDVVISRKRFRLDKALTPDASLPDFEFYRAVQAWRERHGLPEDAFITIGPEVAGGRINEAKQARSGRVDLSNHKPLHVCFSNPLDVRLFKRALGQNEFGIQVQETLPTLNDQHVRFAEQPHVAEFQFELAWTPEEA